MKTFNINDKVRVRLTATGRAILQAHADELRVAFPSLRPYIPPKEDENGYSEWELWSLMEQFGTRVSMGFDLPFETEIQLIDREVA